MTASVMAGGKRRGGGGRGRVFGRWGLPLAMLAVLCCTARAADEYVWWEGEDAKAVSNDISDRHPFDARHEELTGGVSFGSAKTGPGTFMEFEVKVPAAGEWRFFVRKFWHHGPFRFRWNDGPWSEVQRLTLLDKTPLNEHCMNWMTPGKVTLNEGVNRLRLESLERYGAFAVDCFVLIRGAAVPRGKLKPDEKYGRAEEGWFPFEPDRDTFGESPIDMRRLNEQEAGSKGRVVRRGKDLAFEKTAEQVRFWGVTAVSSAWMLDRDLADHLARRLAKMGVNMVRFHVAPYYKTEPGPQTAGVHYLMAALKKQGIYSGFNWYCLAVARVQDSWGLEGFKQGDRPFSLHLYYPPMQEIYKRWARTLFGTVNPHTGMSMAEDPAVAYIELIDEDNYLFWTFKPQNINPKALPYLEKEFGAWLAKKYGSLDKAFETWGPEKKPQHGTDDAKEGRAALYPAMFMGGVDWMQAGRNHRRASDQIRFFTDDIRAFNSGMKQWLHDELGYQGLVVGTNWKTVDERVAGPLDMYGNMAVDITARNTYFAGRHKGRSYRWDVGDHYIDKTLLLDPQAAITMHVQYAGYPHFITEGGWAMPNRFRTEEQLVMAAYASLQGIDGLFPFVVEPDWLDMMNMWPIQTPATIGQYPAASLIYRLGYVDEGPVAINEALRLEDLYEFKGGAMSQPLGLDELRAADVPEGVRPEVESLGSLDPLAFYVGRVIRTIGDEPGKSQLLRGLPGYIERDKKMLRSATGQLRFDYGNGLLTVNAPCAQGVTGFLARAGEVRLDNLTVNMDNEYGAVIAVSLDGEPLASSSRILVQVMTEEQQYGWHTKPARTEFKGAGELDCKQITNGGLPPIVVRKIAGRAAITWAEPAGFRIVALDANGYPRLEMLPGMAGDGRTAAFDLLPDCLYYVITRPGLED